MYANRHFSKIPSQNMLFIKYFTTFRCYIRLKVLKYNFSTLWIMLFHVSFNSLFHVCMIVLVTGSYLYDFLYQKGQSPIQQFSKNDHTHTPRVINTHSYVSVQQSPIQQFSRNVNTHTQSDIKYTFLCECQIYKTVP